MKRGLESEKGNSKNKETREIKKNGERCVTVMEHGQ